jgi:glycogen(starch) synthase
VLDWYARAAIYAPPARYEPFGLSALEVALSGCALVLGDIANQRETWQDAAMYVSPDDPQALASALSELIGDGGRREELARRSCRRALTITPERMVCHYLDAYQSGMPRRSPVTEIRRQPCVS